MVKLGIQLAKSLPEKYQVFLIRYLGSNRYRETGHNNIVDHKGKLVTGGYIGYDPMWDRVGLQEYAMFELGDALLNYKITRHGVE